MLISFSIQNFKSILDITLSTRFDEGKAPNGYKDSEYLIFLEEAKERVSPILSIYGANASGKSNIIDSFSIFKNIIFEGVEKTPFIPNKLNNKYKATTFCLEIVLNLKKYKYTISYDNNTILFEKLICNDKIIFSCDNKQLKNIIDNNKFYDNEKLKNIYNIECKDLNQNQVYSLLMKLSTNYANLYSDITKVYNYLLNQFEISYDTFRYRKYDALQCLSKEMQSEELALLEITNLIKKFDIDIENISKEVKNSDISSYNSDLWSNLIDINTNDKTAKYCKFYTYHKDLYGNIQKFDLKEESQGTQLLFSMIAIVLSTLKKGGVLLVDELDNSLHPLLLVQITNLFKDKRYNKLNAQLIFTLHCTDLLEDSFIRKSEVGIVTKNKKNGSTFKKLSTYSNLRNVMDFRKRYLNGEFSGIPFAYI